MNLLKEKVKLFLSSLLSISLLNRLKQNIIWRKIKKEKKIKYLSRVTTRLPHDEFNKKVRSVVWDEAAKLIGEDCKVLYIELGVWEGYSIKYFKDYFLLLDKNKTLNRL